MQLNVPLAFNFSVCHQAKFDQVLQNQAASRMPLAGLGGFRKHRGLCKPVSQVRKSARVGGDSVIAVPQCASQESDSRSIYPCHL
jgi:hypothetical protein